MAREGSLSKHEQETGEGFTHILKRFSVIFLELGKIIFVVKRHDYLLLRRAVFSLLFAARSLAFR